MLEVEFCLILACKYCILTMYPYHASMSISIAGVRCAHVNTIAIPSGQACILTISQSSWVSAKFCSLLPRPYRLASR